MHAGRVCEANGIARSRGRERDVDARVLSDILSPDIPFSSTDKNI
jgi:hypothetical protein